jgi:hypothetical protein
MLTITHSFAEGTLIEGMVRGDGSYEIVTGIQGWKWFRSLKTCGIIQSRDRISKSWLINAAAEKLRAAGFTVTVEVDDNPRPMAEREADRAAHMDERADMLAERAGRRGAESAAKLGRADQIAERFAGGQPILIGHHSENKARRDQDRIHNLTGQGLELRREAVRLADAAEGAADHMTHRENPMLVARRVEKLEADRRGVQRNLDGYTRNFRNGRGEIVSSDVTKPATGEWRERQLLVAADLDTQIAYWRAFLEQAKADGQYNPVDVAAIRPGDAIKAHGRWERVVKVNKATITVAVAPGWANKVKINEITEHRPATIPVALESE